MAFYIIKQNTLIEGSVALDALPDIACDWLEPNCVLAGKSLGEPVQPFNLPLSQQSGKYFGSMINSLLPLFHVSLKNALTNFGVDNIQYHPVNLLDQNGLVDNAKLAGVYFIANIIGSLDCIDMQKSNIRPWPSGRAYDLLSLAIDENKTQGLKIFRIQDDPTLIIINEALKHYLVDELNLLVGVEVINTQDYSKW